MLKLHRPVFWRIGGSSVGPGDPPSPFQRLHGSFDVEQCHCCQGGWAEGWRGTSSQFTHTHKYMYVCVFIYISWLLSYLPTPSREHGLKVPKVEDSCYQAVQHDGEEQRDDVENGKVDEVDGQVELPLHPVATLHMSIQANLKETHLPCRRSHKTTGSGMMSESGSLKRQSAESVWNTLWTWINISPTGVYVQIVVLLC